MRRERKNRTIDRTSDFDRRGRRPQETAVLLRLSLRGSIEAHQAHEIEPGQGLFVGQSTVSLKTRCNTTASPATADAIIGTEPEE